MPLRAYHFPFFFFFNPLCHFYTRPYLFLSSISFCIRFRLYLYLSSMPLSILLRIFAFFLFYFRSLISTYFPFPLYSYSSFFLFQPFHLAFHLLPFVILLSFCELRFSFIFRLLLLALLQDLSLSCPVAPCPSSRVLVSLLWYSLTAAFLSLYSLRPFPWSLRLAPSSSFPFPLLRLALGYERSSLLIIPCPFIPHAP